MPEGDTVWRAARKLDQALSGARLAVCDFRVPQLATVDLVGADVINTVARGKHLLTRLRHEEHGDISLHTHLKMEGAWQVYAPGARWRRPVHQARVLLGTTDHTAVGFSLGIVELVPTAAEGSVVGHLGPDLLGSDWDAEEAVRRLLAEPQRSIHAALLDQRNLAGVGNMYAAEVCFLQGVHPQTPVGEIPRLSRLVGQVQQMLDLNRRRAVQATTGDLRDGQRFWVYRRDRRPCRRCRTLIEVAMFATDGSTGPAEPEAPEAPGLATPRQRERACYWCPHCQPTP